MHAPYLEAPAGFLLKSVFSLHLPSVAYTLSEMHFNRVRLLQRPMLQALCLISLKTGRDCGLQWME